MALIEYTKRMKNTNENEQDTFYVWFFFFLLLAANGKGFHCGGVLINENYVITGEAINEAHIHIHIQLILTQICSILASHCVNGKDLVQLRWTLSGLTVQIKMVFDENC